MNQTKHDVTILFAGDSGDGIQITGNQFTITRAKIGNTIQTFPDYPAEIRAPIGTQAGVSGFQLRFADTQIYTPGDAIDVFVAFNPAALIVHKNKLHSSSQIIIDEEKFTAKEYKKASISDPDFLSDLKNKYTVLEAPISRLTLDSLKDIDIRHAHAKKCKNMFALGLIAWMFHQDLTTFTSWLKQKFKLNPEIQKANILALNAGFNYAENTELTLNRFEVADAKLTSGTYRHITGNEATALGVATVAGTSEVEVLSAGYPITPASTILHAISKYKKEGVLTFQAEDEMAAIGAALGASFAGKLGFCCTSGPGLDLKAETLGLAVMAELPLVVLNVQRAGPSTGMPTKLEQADLMSAMYNRHGEAPLPILAPKSPADCFNIILHAFKIATKYMTPVIVLSDAYLANGAEPFKLPELENLPKLEINYASSLNNQNKFSPYKRDSKTNTRLWAIPGTPELMHQIGGLEKDSNTSEISYCPENHAKMINLRAYKINQSELIDEAFLYEKYSELHTDVLVVGWGSSYGVIKTAKNYLANKNINCDQLHFRQLNPIAKQVKTIFSKYKNIFVIEYNSGQLLKLLRAEFLCDAQGINQVTGQPFTTEQLAVEIEYRINLN